MNLIVTVCVVRIAQANDPIRHPLVLLTFHCVWKRPIFKSPFRRFIVLLRGVCVCQQPTVDLTCYSSVAKVSLAQNRKFFKSEKQIKCCQKLRKRNQKMSAQKERKRESGVSRTDSVRILTMQMNLVHNLISNWAKAEQRNNRRLWCNRSPDSVGNCGTVRIPAKLGVE